MLLVLRCDIISVPWVHLLLVINSWRIFLLVSVIALITAASIKLWLPILPSQSETKFSDVLKYLKAGTLDHYRNFRDRYRRFICLDQLYRAVMTEVAFQQYDYPYYGYCRPGNGSQTLLEVVWQTNFHPQNNQLFIIGHDCYADSGCLAEPY
ncbi:hypothetical protein CS542_09470 [Pedobacter sp. IW39]|nr:hypothetical protein CS542_09470 [Pedobacter sp. IW39]